jgi:drug/metabolite transporter (DMT)-like permease
VNGDRAPAWQIWLALFVVYVVWGSTYLAIAVVVQTMPPLLSASIRHLIAGVLLFAVLAVRHGPGVLRLNRAEMIGSAFVGLALLLGGNGLVMLAERDVPSGLTALIIAIVPLWVVLLRLGFGERVGRGTLFGVAVGFAGVAVLVLPDGLSGSTSLIGTVFLVLAGISWAFGSYYSRRLRLPSNPFVSTGAQLLLGGLGLAVAGLLAGEMGLVQPARFSTESVVALGYLVVFGSLLGYTAYTWLLQATSVSKVATYAYVNPVVAIFLGWLVLNEQITPAIVIGGAMIVVSVGLVVRTESRPAASVAVPITARASAHASAPGVETGDR